MATTDSRRTDAPPPVTPITLDQLNGRPLWVVIDGQDAQAGQGFMPGVPPSVI